MEVIEGSRIQNYRSRRDVAMERIGTDQKMRDGAPFTPLTVSDQVRTLHGGLLRDGRQIFENRGLAYERVRSSAFGNRVSALSSGKRKHSNRGSPPERDTMVEPFTDGRSLRYR